MGECECKTGNKVAGSGHDLLQYLFATCLEKTGDYHEGSQAEYKDLGRKSSSGSPVYEETMLPIPSQHSIVVLSLSREVFCVGNDWGYFD
jgi:hypothetical protein